jgi:septal ring factor EnvC (AmiA/AmiB activator)
MLNKKIAVIEQEAAKQQEETAAKVKEKKVSKKTSETTRAVTKSVLKVLTSATFIRGAFGVLSKLLKK